MYTLNLAQQNQAQNIVNLTLGDGYIDISKIKSTGYKKYKIYTITLQHKIIGIAWICWLNKNKLIHKSLHKLSYSNKTPIIDVVAVHPKFQNKGIGKKLFHQIFNPKNIPHILCFAWDYNGEIHLEKLLLKNNFKSIISFNNYYLKESLFKGFSCSACGFPCTCGIKIFRKSI